MQPGEYGIPKSWFFPVYSVGDWLRDRYWAIMSSRGMDVTPLLGSTVRNPSYSGTTTDFQDEESENFERDPHGMRVGIQLQNVRKTFGAGNVAVENTTFNIYEGHITTLLGHNGAGTTRVGVGRPTHANMGSIPQQRRWHWPKHQQYLCNGIFFVFKRYTQDSCYNIRKLRLSRLSRE